MKKIQLFGFHYILFHMNFRHPYSPIFLVQNESILLEESQYIIIIIIYEKSTI